MKKTLILLILFSSFSYALDFTIGKNIVSNGFFKIEDSNLSIKDTFGLYAEVYKDQVDLYGLPVKAGVGIKFNNYLDKANENGISTVATLYGIGRFEWDLSTLKPYAQFRFGYPYASEGDYIITYNDPNKIYHNDLVGIYYLSLGLGATVSFVDLSINYELNTYKLKSDNFSEKNITSGNVSFNVGIKF